MAGIVCEKILSLCNMHDVHDVHDNQDKWDRKDKWDKIDKQIYQAMRDGKCKYCSVFHSIPIWYSPNNWNSFYIRENGINMIYVSHPRRKNPNEYFVIPTPDLDLDRTK